MEAETIDHLQESETKTTLAIQIPPAAQAAPAIRMIIIITDTIKWHDKKEDDKNDSLPK